MANSDNNKEEAPLAFTENIIDENNEKRLAKDAIADSGDSEDKDINPIDGEEIAHNSKFNPYQDVVNDFKTEEDEK